MSSSVNNQPVVAVVDYGLGNLFSIKHACDHVGLSALITSDKNEILNADAVILPGVGAFGDAIMHLNEKKLFDVVRDVAGSGKPLLGLCLGLQLLMSESHEFGIHKGLDIIKGKVVRFDNPRDENNRTLKVPHVGWNGVYHTQSCGAAWENSLLKDIRQNEDFYFVHSYHVVLDNPEFALSYTRYGNQEFCSAIQKGNVFACQYHPERSGPQGLKVYQNFAQMIMQHKKGNSL